MLTQIERHHAAASGLQPPSKDRKGWKRVLVNPSSWAFIGLTGVFAFILYYLYRLEVVSIAQSINQALQDQISVTQAQVHEAIVTSTRYAAITAGCYALAWL